MRVLDSILATVFAGVCTTACASSREGSPGGAGTEAEGPPTTCTSASGAASSCPIEVAGTYCPKSDARSCLVLTREEVSEGSEGPCLRLVLENRCGQVAYSEIRIGYTHANRGAFWQGWTSTTLAGASVDVALCAATGRYAIVSSLSPGRLDVLSTQCPMTP
jgi:hypothetical protein